MPTERKGPTPEINNQLFEETCKCGNIMEKDANFCPNCGRSRAAALRDKLTWDEQKMLTYIQEQGTVSVIALLRIPFFHLILDHFTSVLRSLAAKGRINLYKLRAGPKKPAP